MNVPWEQSICRLPVRLHCVRSVDCFMARYRPFAVCLPEIRDVVHVCLGTMFSWSAFRSFALFVFVKVNHLMWMRWIGESDGAVNNKDRILQSILSFIVLGCFWWIIDYGCKIRTVAHLYLMYFDWWVLISAKKPGFSQLEPVLHYVHWIYGNLSIFECCSSNGV